ncbi:peptidylprolyl isomerase [Candidatus Woesearchaeota archaeon]|jgi:peptidylprolyl isomerase|nr:peptidylprolyl isomerase [Candidatus Woesearchaeota archaeon]
MAKKAKKGDIVNIEYEGSLEDGTVFDSTEKHGKPLEFEIGSKKVIKGFEEAVMDMEKGEEKKITLKPEEAYGNPNPDLIKEIPREKLPKEQEPKKGMILGMMLPNGHQIPARITKVEEDKVTIDLNHPLAGKTLNFDIKLVDFS